MNVTIQPIAKKILVPILTVLVAVGFIGLLSYLHLSKNQVPVHAAAKENWIAGNIISDSNFTDKNSMSVSEIQTFLDSKISCDIWGTGTATEFGSSQTRAQYAASRGWAGPPYTCLNKYHEVPKTTPGGNMPANNYSNPSSIPSGAQSAAWIIKDAANRYNISPKILLVKIATESVGPLTSDNWPLFSQYRYAMGSHCPDSGPGGSANCDPAYAGFSIQMYSAAELMRWYLDSMNQPWWSYKKPYQNNQILWNVAPRGCGSSNVYIENKATAALYTYTPYQPNAAALNNLYGTGDNCSAYGNRNVWRVYWDWFGNTRSATSYTWSSVSQSVFSDENRTRKLPYNTVLHPGQTIYVTIKAKNTGDTVWSNTNIRLATSQPNDRKSGFHHTSWINSNRVAKLTESTVAPGETGTFTFTITAPEKSGKYKEYFNIVIEGSRWLSDIGLYLPVEVKNTRAITLYRDRDRTIPITKAYLGETIYARAMITNNTALPLPASTRIATTDPNDRPSTLRTDSWISDNRITSLGSDVLPGQTKVIDFTLQAPTNITSTSDKFGLVNDGPNGDWIEQNSLNVRFDTQERPPDRIASQGVITANVILSNTRDTHKLVLQSDGNLVLYSNSRAIWATDTVGKGGNKLVLQSDGNLVLYSNSRAIWATDTVGKGGNKLVLQSDGNLVLYSNSRAIWATDTVGK